MLIAQGKPLSALGTVARQQWARLRDDLDATFWGEKYDPQTLQETKDALTTFLAPASTMTLGHVEKSLSKLSTSLLPAKKPAELERTFWQRVGEARHQSYLYQLHAIYKAAAISTEHLLAKAEFEVLSFARAYDARVNQISADRLQKKATPAPVAATSPAPTAAPAERFHDLPPADQARIRTQITVAIGAIEKISPTALSPSQQAAVGSYLKTVEAYLRDAARPADLAIAAAAIEAAAPPQARDSTMTPAWRDLELDARNTATLTRQLTALRKPTAPAAAPSAAPGPSR